MDILKLIDGVYDDWVLLKDIDKGAEIAPGVQMISCDTRDFGIGWSFEQPKAFSNADCGFEHSWNAGIMRLCKVLNKKSNDGDCIIEQSDIFTWLDSVCMASGGYDDDWRFLRSDIAECRSWELKYIRFVRKPGDESHFVVCNGYLTPIPWKEVLPNLMVGFGSKSETQERIYNKDKYDALVGYRFRPTFDSPIEYFEIRGYDAERDMVLTTAHPKEGNPFDDEIEERYLMGAFETGDYEPVRDMPLDNGQTVHVLTNPFGTAQEPTAVEPMFCGPCCSRCHHRFGTTYNRGWCCDHLHDEKCYRFKLEK